MSKKKIIDMSGSSVRARTTQTEEEKNLPYHPYSERKVKILDGYLKDEYMYFLKWIVFDENNEGETLYAICESVEGRVEPIFYRDLQFIPSAKTIAERVASRTK